MELHYGALRRREQEPSTPSPFARVAEFDTPQQADRYCRIWR